MTLVPADEARDHLNRLRRYVSTDCIAALSGLAPRTVKEIAAVLRQHTDDPNIAALDLVAVRTSDGVTAAMEQVTPHPQCRGC